MTTDLLRDKIRARGLRATTSRLATFAAMHRLTSPTHAEVVEAMGPGDWDRATVFRNLSDLTRVKLLRRLDVGDHLWRFELTSKPRRAERRGES